MPNQLHELDADIALRMRNVMLFRDLRPGTLVSVNVANGGSPDWHDAEVIETDMEMTGPRCVRVKLNTNTNVLWRGLGDLRNRGAGRSLQVQLDRNIAEEKLLRESRVEQEWIKWAPGDLIQTRQDSFPRDANGDREWRDGVIMSVDQGDRTYTYMVGWNDAAGVYTQQWTEDAAVRARPGTRTADRATPAPAPARTEDEALAGAKSAVIASLQTLVGNTEGLRKSVADGEITANDIRDLLDDHVGQARKIRHQLDNVLALAVQPVVTAAPVKLPTPSGVCGSCYEPVTFDPTLTDEGTWVHATAGAPDDEGHRIPAVILTD